MTAAPPRVPRSAVADRVSRPPSPVTSRTLARTVRTLARTAATTVRLTVTGAALLALVAALPWLRDDDPARTVLRARLAEREPDPAALAQVRAELGLAADPLTGAVRWLAGAFHGDLGRSWVDGAPVAQQVIAAAGVSAGLAAAAASLAAVVGLLWVVPGVWRAARPDRPPRVGGAVTGSMVAAVPEFVLAAVLLGLVAVRWRLAPTSGWAGPADVPLPAIAIGLPAAGLLSRIVAAAAEDALAEQWVRTWRMAGFARWRVATAALRRGLAVATPQLLMLFAGLLGGAVAVEEIFAIPGLGRLALRATLAQDLPVVQGCVLLLTVVGGAVGVGGIVLHRALLGPAGAHIGLAPAVVSAGHPTGWRRYQRLAPLAVASAVLGLAVPAGLLRDATTVRLDQRLHPPSPAHPLGTDPVGRDVLAQLGHGTLRTLGIAVAVTAISLLVGLAIGVLGQRSRAGTADILNALPPVLLGVVVAAVAGPGLLAAGVAAALVAWVPLAVHCRTLAVEVRASGYHQAAVLAGAGPSRLLGRHILPAVVGPVTMHAATRLPGVALTVASLSFLGLGAAHDTPEWGAQLAAALDYLERAPHVAAAPTLALTLLGVLAAGIPAGSARVSRRPGVMPSLRRSWPKQSRPQP